MREANDFVLAQFDAALEGRPALTQAEVEGDATLGGLRDLFPFADRDGDGRLSRPELKAYLQLVRLGTAAQTWVTVSERGRSLFHLLDADGDGRLGYAELARATGRLNGATSRKAVVPWQCQVAFSGPSVPSWGGVPVPTPRRPRPSAKAVANTPGWFQAMDRNGDGVLSPNEFVGPPNVFHRLDANGDGMISPDEASRGGAND
jgi:Ca2+-binding EF-hand superfamily protein